MVVETRRNPPRDRSGKPPAAVLAKKTVAPSAKKLVEKESGERAEHFESPGNSSS